MSGTTISQSYVNGLSLTNAAADNPVTILSGVTIGTPSGPALAASGTIDWTITNYGTVQTAGTSTGSYGIVTQGGGTVTNAAGGMIKGGYAGVSMATAGTVLNQGTVAGSFGTLSDGVALAGGGEVGNASGGVISGGGYGIVLNAAGAVTNDGSISGAANSGVLMTADGVIVNNTASTIEGYLTGVSIVGAGSVVNQGSIGSGNTAGSGYYYNNISHVFRPLTGGVIMDSGGIDNEAAGSITSYFFAVVAATTTDVVNAGRIDGSSTKYGFGIFLQSGGSVTNASSGGIFGGDNAVAIGGTSASTLLNAGSIAAVNRIAVDLYGAGGYVSNAATGTMTSDYITVLLRGAGADVVNDGSIAGTRLLSGAAVDMIAGGTVTNAAGANITGKWIGTQIYVGGTVLNSGNIFASDGTNGAGVWLHGPGEVSNASSGTIAGGPFGVVLYNATTLFNAGTITGTEFAVSATPGYAERFIVTPGATFSGTVNGGNALTSTIVSVLELTAGPSIGTIAGFGSNYVDFRQIVLDSGASWSLGGTVQAAQTVSFGGADTTLTLSNPGSMAGDVFGFSASDTIVLAGVTGVTSAMLNVANQLTVVPGSGPDLTFQFDPTQTFSGTNFNTTQVGDNTDLTVPCFAAGTRIATSSGEVAVEQLRVGDRVLTRGGALLAVAWLGHRRTDCRRHVRPSEVWPVRVRVGAFGPGMPHRDLLISPDHAVLVDGNLIPVRYLINGATITQEKVDEITYWHVELTRHAVLLAEGLPCESYLDTGNRASFGNAASVQQPFAAKAQPASVADDDVVVQHDRKRARGVADFAGHFDVIA
jgi:hypothetical protein